MLYVTTRDQREVYTVQYPLTQNRAPDGGLFLPFHSPSFSEAEIAGLKEQTFNQTAAALLNRMFGTKLSSWDLDFAIGRYPVRIYPLRHRILMGETWHNPEWDFARVLRILREKVGSQLEPYPGNWLEIGIRIAVLFGIYSELLRSEILQPGEKIDVSTVSGEFTGPISAWYARQWGLPIGSIICCCNENSELWNLICQGQFHTGNLSVSTSTPEADVAKPENLERLIYGCGGTGEVERYLESCRRGGLYVPGDGVLAKLRNGMFVSVISNHRMEKTIPGVYTTHGYLLSPYTALAYGGLLDYRAKTGQLRHALVLAEKSPSRDAQTVCRAMKITKEELQKLL